MPNGTVYVNRQVYVQYVVKKRNVFTPCAAGFPDAGKTHLSTPGSVAPTPGTGQEFPDRYHLCQSAFFIFHTLLQPTGNSNRSDWEFIIFFLFFRNMHKSDRKPSSWEVAYYNKESSTSKIKFCSLPDREVTR